VAVTLAATIQVILVLRAKKTGAAPR